uniref:Protein S100-A10 n=1 Tax=Otus sunia TaxID=257818 RepID=A0A8C8AG18_9STRI
MSAPAMPSQMEHAMETLMFTFHKYAGDKNHLSKEDLRALMEKEFPGFLEVGAAAGGGPYSTRGQPLWRPEISPYSAPRSQPVAPQEQTRCTPGSGPIAPQNQPL